MLKKAQNRRKGFGVTYLISRHEYPVARLQAGIFLAQQKLARAMIDISDGLVQDLGHLCRASGVGAVVWENSLPLSRPYRTCAGTKGTRYALTGGEDYELLFCARAPARKRLENIGTRLGVKVTRIGACVPSGKGIRVLDKRGRAVALSSWGYDQFKN
jgi:thiamine-monophosphate kinase